MHEHENRLFILSICTGEIDLDPVFVGGRQSRGLIDECLKETLVNSGPRDGRVERLKIVLDELLCLPIRQVVGKSKNRIGIELRCPLFDRVSLTELS